ncbi:uncharacterized protein ACIBXB_014275 [Morphnus guianensis]
MTLSIRSSQKAAIAAQRAALHDFIPPCGGEVGNIIISCLGVLTRCQQWKCPRMYSSSAPRVTQTCWEVGKALGRWRKSWRRGEMGRKRCELNCFPAMMSWQQATAPPRRLLSKPYIRTGSSKPPGARRRVPFPGEAICSPPPDSFCRASSSPAGLESSPPPPPPPPPLRPGSHRPSC